MASMFVVAAGLTRTQMINNVTRLLYKVTEGSFTKVLASYVVITCIIGQFVPSIVAIFALVHPLVQNMCDRMNISPSKMMYPIAIAAVSTSFIIEPIGPYGRLVCDAERVHGVLWVDLYPAEHVERDGGLPAGGDRHYPAGHFCCSSLPPRSAGAAHYGHRRRKLQEQAPLSPVREFLGYGVFVAVILGLMLGYTSWQVTLIGAIVLVASGVLTEREAIENMNMSTVLLYVGVSAFGTALAQTGAAEMLADVFSKMLDGITNGYIVGFTFYVVGFLMTSLLYNRAVSTVLIPLVVITCSSIGCDPRGPIILVALSTMSSLVTPMATAVVPMAMNAGGYSAKTCLKVGLIPGVVRGIVGTLIAMTLYPM